VFGGRRFHHVKKLMDIGTEELSHLEAVGSSARLHLWRTE
jgi:Mn-containing catalase